MDNRIGSQVKRGLKVTGDYLVTLVIFGVFSSIVFSLAKENVERGIFIFSIVMFLVMFSMIYSNMNNIAYKEKRPQYNINPSPYKGFMYGFIGALPVFVVQLMYYLIDLFIEIPEEFFILRRRILQAFTGPLYWLAKIISDEVWAYHVVLLVIPLIAGLGYLAGHRGFYLMKKIKIFNKLNKNNKKTIEKK